MLTGIVLAHNEEANLPQVLASLRFCDQILVIDDDSTDKTAQIAAQAKVSLISHSLNGDFSAQRNFALSQVKSGWVLFVDADEIISSELAEELVSAVQSARYSGYYIPRRDVMWNRPLLHGDVGQIKLLRLGLAGSGKWVGMIHETWQIPGNIGTLNHPLMHHPHPSEVSFLRHLNFYSTLRAAELAKSGRKSSLFQIIFYPPAKFVFLWIFKLGFLDGTPGFIHAMTMAFYTFLVRGKLYLL